MAKRIFESMKAEKIEVDSDISMLVVGKQIMPGAVFIIPYMNDGFADLRREGYKTWDDFNPDRVGVYEGGIVARARIGRDGMAERLRDVFFINQLKDVGVWHGDGLEEQVEGYLKLLYMTRGTPGTETSVVVVDDNLFRAPKKTIKKVAGRYAQISFDANRRVFERALENGADSCLKGAYNPLTPDGQRRRDENVKMTIYCGCYGPLRGMASVTRPGEDFNLIRPSY